MEKLSIIGVREGFIYLFKVMFCIRNLDFSACTPHELAFHDGVRIGDIAILVDSGISGISEISEIQNPKTFVENR